jgi:NADH-quinone oxidoreductase subunit C
MSERAAVRSAGLDQPAGDEPCLDVDASEWVGAARELIRQGFTYFDWLTAVDQTDAVEAPGFDVVLHLLDVSTPGALRGHLLRIRIPDGTALPSLTGQFAGAAWHERETHEMFGIDFDGHPDPAPLLLPDGFEGHPLRKDFVLAARVAKQWPGEKEPGGASARRRVRPPGVPEDWEQA